jgi:hypothetical protein
MPGTPAQQPAHDGKSSSPGLVGDVEDEVLSFHASTLSSQANRSAQNKARAGRCIACEPLTVGLAEVTL